MAEERDITYINRDFSDFKSQLVEYAKNYFPDTYNDFSATSPGMMFIEMASYVGDILAFYQDSQLQETYLTYAKNPKNLFNLAYMMGYRPKLTSVSEVELYISQLLPADSNYNPDWSQAAFISASSIVQSTDNTQTQFILNDSVNFNVSSSYDTTDVIIDSLDSNNRPTQYTIVKKAKAYSGQIKTTTLTAGGVDKFKTYTITDNNIIGVLDIVDADGNKWYEVPFLGQDTVYKEETNNNSDSNLAPYNLTVQKAPRRFITRLQSNGSINIQFGAGTNSTDDSELLPDPTNVGNGTSVGVSKLDYAFDPSNFLQSKAYGLAPTTDLTVRYIVGGGVSANVPANTITYQYSVSGTNLTNISFNNPKPAYGGRSGDTVEELRENSLKAFSEQGRAVTLQDYTVRALSLPAKYGSIAKAFVVQDQLTNSNLDKDTLLSNNPLALSLYVLAYDSKGKLTTSTPTLKNNLKNYLSEYALITDSINIKDAFVVNIGIDYEIIVRPDYSGRDVLLGCNLKIQEMFKTSKRSINQPINISDIYRELDKVKGVQTVQKISIKNLQGGNYSQFGYDIKGATRNNVIFPSYDPCIFELKYPAEDIRGRVTTL